MLGSGAITQTYLAESLSDDVRGTGLGVIQTVTSTLASGGPVLFGAIADRGYLDLGYVGLAVVTAAAVVLILCMPRP